MKVTVNASPEPFQTSDSRVGTVWKAQLEGNDVIIVKIKSDLYIRIGSNGPSIFGPEGVSWNPVWSTYWKNPEELKSGTVITIEI